MRGRNLPYPIALVISLYNSKYEIVIVFWRQNKRLQTNKGAYALGWAGVRKGGQLFGEGGKCMNTCLHVSTSGIMEAVFTTWWYMPWPCAHVSPSVCQSHVRVLSIQQNRAGFAHESFLQPTLHCVIRKFWYLKNKGTSLWNFAPNSGIKTFHHGETLC